MKIEYKNETDIKALVVMAIALLCAWFGRVDWIVAVLFCMTNMTLLYQPKKESKEELE